MLALSLLAAVALQSANVTARLELVPIGPLRRDLETRVEAGDAFAMVGLAELQLAEGGNVTEALQLLRRAGTAGQPCALLRAARIGRSVLIDLVTANADLERAVTLGCPDANYELATMLLSQNRDGTRANDLLLQLAANGDARALLFMARAQVEGRGFGNLGDAVTLYRRAAITGTAEAQGELAQLLLKQYEEGGSVQALREALYWALILAARGGDAARAQARQISEVAITRLGRRAVADIQNAAARFANGRYTLPAQSEPRPRNRP